MRQPVIASFAVISLLVTTAAPLRAQDAPSPAKAQTPQTPQEEWSTTEHSLEVGSGRR